MLVQLLYLPDCPHAEEARRAIHDALADLRPAAEIDDVDISDPSTPPALRAWGSPTILIDGVDVEGEQPTGAPCCRVSGAPSREAIAAALVKRIGGTR